MMEAAWLSSRRARPVFPLMLAAVCVGSLACSPGARTSTVGFPSSPSWIAHATPTRSGGPSPVQTPLVSHGTFTATGSLVESLYEPFAVALIPDGQVLVVGGAAPDAASAAGVRAELYDPATRLMSLTGAVDGGSTPTVTLLGDGRVLVVTTSNASPHGGALYDPGSGLFTQPRATLTYRLGQTATLLQDGKVLIAGGWGTLSATRDGYLATAEIYNPLTDTDTPTGSMKSARESAVAVLLHNGKVLMLGGDEGYARDEMHPIASAELYDPASGKFTAAGSAGALHYGGTATVLNDGRVLIAGGGMMDATAKAEIYDPSTGKFTATGSMTAVRANQTATLLTDGKVLIAGGDGGDDDPLPLSSAELYDPATGTFTATGSMTAARTGQAAVLLGNGSVLLIGGETVGGQAEVYQP